MGQLQGQEPASPLEQMFQMVAGFWVSRAIFAAAELGLADRVQGGPKSADELAAATGMHGRSMYRLLRALASVGVFREREDHTFEQTPLSDTLRTDARPTLRSTVRSELGISHYGAWERIIDGIRTGKPTFDLVFGEPVFSWFGMNPERAQIFNQSMSELTALVEPAVLEAYDFSDCGPTLVDVGGGHGSLIAGILAKHHQLKGVVFDEAHVVAGAQAVFASHGVTDRASTAAGDFWEAVPAGGDTYLMKHIIHDWDDDRCQAILRNCHAVMKPGGRVLIIDQVIPEGNTPGVGKFSDLLMLLMPGGTERTAAEFKALLEASSFTLNRIVSTGSPVSVIEGIRR